MSVDLSNYDIYVYRGTTYKLDFSYTDNNNVGIDLSNQTAKMQIRKSRSSPQLLAELDENFPSGCFFSGLTSDGFSSGFGITGYTGGLILNYNGNTGSIHVEMDIECTFSIPVGRHYYDLQLVGPTGEQTTLLKGRIEVNENSYMVQREFPYFVGEQGITGESR